MWSRILGTPLVPSQVELLDASVIADQMRKPGENAKTKHMGEAETIAVINRRQLSAVFLTDDFDAARRARVDAIPVASTTKILAIAEVKDRLTHEEARNCLPDLSNLSRILGNPPSIAQYDSYVSTLKELRASNGNAATP